MPHPRPGLRAPMFPRKAFFGGMALAIFLGGYFEEGQTKSIWTPKQALLTEPLPKRLCDGRKPEKEYQVTNTRDYSFFQAKIQVLSPLMEIKKFSIGRYEVNRHVKKALVRVENVIQGESPTKVPGGNFYLYFVNYSKGFLTDKVGKFFYVLGRRSKKPPPRFPKELREAFFVIPMPLGVLQNTANKTCFNQDKVSKG